MKPYPDMNKESNEHLPSAKFPVPLLVLMETDSTNRHLTQLCDEQGTDIPEFMTVIAERQTAGKGQRGNSWESEDCKNITFSFVLYPTFIEARQQFILSQIISLSIKEELDEWAEGISIKWPNDIYWNEKKICGILIENDLLGHHIGRSISGIGVNINQEVFRSDAPNPVSLKQITGEDHDRYLILANIMKRIKEYYTLLRTDCSGKTADFNVKLALTTVHKSTNMVPLKDSLVVTSIKNTNKCIDKNNYEVCSLYKLTLSNTGSSFTLNGYLKTSSTTYTTGNLKYQVYDTNYNAVTDVLTPSLTASQKVYFKKGSNNISTTINSTNVEYYLVMWITETNTMQTADYSKNYSGVVGFEAISGDVLEANLTT